MRHPTTPTPKLTRTPPLAVSLASHRTAGNAVPKSPSFERAYLARSTIVSASQRLVVWIAKAVGGTDSCRTGR